MVQNRNKLIELFIGNISNAVVHKILEEVIDDNNIRNHYDKELKVSFDKAKSYREKINPISTAFPDRDSDYIKNKIIKKAKAELQLRISKGYENINLDLVEIITENMLKDMNII